MIDSFRGPYRFLSNFAPVPHGIRDADFIYLTVEHAYQAAKTDSLSLRRAIATARTPGDAKRLGRHAPVREGWEEMRVPVMYGLLRQKFKPGSDLAAQLRATGDVALVEGNTWGDRFWGVCDGTGLNTLGRLLMIVRAELQGD
jgi:ribA/ribD-fused uncharacterized protein